MLPIENLAKLLSESEIQYSWRLYSHVQNGEMTWQDLADLMNKYCREDESEYRTESAYRKRIQSAALYLKEVFSQTSDNEMLASIKEERRELEKERKKYQTEKIEYNKWLRENARDELIAEKIAEAVREIQPLQAPDVHIVDDVQNAKEGILVLADAHYGIEFCIKGLHGEVINEYSPEIFEQRMWYLYRKVCEIIEREKFTTIHIYELGDGIDGIIRLTSQLMKLRYGILESTVKYANFLSEWLNKLSEKVNIKVYFTLDSNHNQLRICGSPKDSFKGENVSMIIKEIVKNRLENNQHIKVVENPTGYPYAKICEQYNVLGIHGEVKNLGKAIDDFGRSYGVKINYIIGGHKHHKENVETGIDCEAISVGSIIGIDSYGLSLNKTSNPCVSFMVFENELGLTTQYNIKLLTK